MDNPFICSFSIHGDGYSRPYVHCNKSAEVFYQTTRPSYMQTAYRIIGRCSNHAVSHPDAWSIKLTREEVLVQQVMDV
jgi:hypothetical protein